MRKDSPMQILFNKTINQCRTIGARGGRAHARNLRIRKLQSAPKAAAETPVPRLETAAEAIAILDRQFPWLIGAEGSRRPQRAAAHETRVVLQVL
jgi:hypothetical protein